MRKFIAPIVGIALLGSLVACAPTEIRAVDDKPAAASTSDKAKEDKPAAAPADTRQDLVVTETAFGQNSYDPTHWWYVVIVENPNTDFVFPSAMLDIEALDATGVILDSSSAYTTLLAGKTALTGSFVSVGDKTISDVSLRGPAATAATKAEASETGAFVLTPEAPVTDEYSTTVSGTISGSFATEQSLVNVAMVARNAAGQIIATDHTYVDRLPVGGTVRYEITLFDPMPADTTYEVYASL